MSIRDRIKKLKERQHGPAYEAAKSSVELAQTIENLMIEQELSKGDFAEKLGVRPSYVTKLLKGDHNLSVLSIAKIADALGVSFDCGLRSKNTARLILLKGGYSAYVGVSASNQNVFKTAKPEARDFARIKEIKRGAA